MARRAAERNPVTDIVVPEIAPAPARRSRARAARTRRPRHAPAVARARRHPRARRRFRRPLFPAFALRELEPRGRHRQVGQRSTSTAASACAPCPARSRPSRIPTTSRWPRSSEAGTRGARHRPPGADRRRAARPASAARARCTRRTIRSASLGDADKVALLERLEAHGARARPARHAGDGVARRRARDGADRAQRRHARRRRAAARAHVDHGHRRGERPARAGLRAAAADASTTRTSTTRCSTTTRGARSTRRCSTSARATRRPAR